MTLSPSDRLMARIARTMAASLRFGGIFSFFSATRRKARRLAPQYSRVGEARIGFQDFETYAALCEIEYELARDATLRRAID